MRKWVLLVCFLPVFREEVKLGALLAQPHWETVVVGGRDKRLEVIQRDSTWAASAGGSGSGGDWCALRIETQQGVFRWMAGHNFGSSWILKQKRAEGPSFLVYQPVLGLTSNYRLIESPHLNDPGVWLVLKTPRGYEREPILTNPLSLAMRNPSGLLVAVFYLLEDWC